ncbi:hypothetical protein PFISCL1PPCAC_7499, partial [Pristionchus fissidentatus]
LRSDDEQSISSSVSNLNRKRINRRCKFIPDCKRDDCAFTHPSRKCKDFPNCKFGGACLFLHDQCPNDGKCNDEKCTNEHQIARNIFKEWCVRGSYCKSENCPHLHPF